MRNLKKFLALVLALMMVVSVMITVSATTFTDADKIGEDYEDAVDVLTTIGVLHGTSDTTFSPTSEITRAEMAAIVYRIMTGDVKDENVKQLSGYDNDFTDVPKDAWYEPYVSYCNNSGWLVGDGKGHFMPKDPVDGHQVLAVLLRCLGYDQPGEFTGPDWRIKTAKIAKEQRITDGLKADVKLEKPLQRQQVAQLTYNVALVAQRVRWTSAFGYTTYGIDGEKMGNLITVPKTTDVKFDLDEWGEPKKGTNTATFHAPIKDVTKDIDVAAPKPLMDPFYVAKDHCDVAKALSLTEDQKFTVYTNGKENNTELTLKALSETDMVGAQGRYTAIYKVNGTYSIVYKDTLLAKVTDVKAATFDKNDHLKTDATLTLEVYDVKDDKTTATLKNGKDDWTYTKDQYLLVNYHQDTAKVDTAVKSFTEDNNDDTKINWKDYYTFLGEPETFEGSQTLVSKNANKHTIDGTAYDDNNRYALDEAKDTMKVPFVWYKDTQGNVIGSTAKSPENGYGVINRIWAVNSDDDGSTTVKATVTYMNGDIGTINVGNLVYFTGKAGVAVTTAGAGLEGGKATYTDSNTNVMKVMTGGDKFYVSDSYDANKTADEKGESIIAGHMFKIVPSTDVKGAYDFIEVAGANSTTDLKIAANKGVLSGLNFKGLGNASTEIESGKANNNGVRVDSNTVFLIRSTDPETQEYVYTTKTGFKSIPDYKADEVDYVNCDNDLAAEYVYIIASEKGAEGWHLFYAASTEDDKDGNALVNVDDNGKTYTVHGYLDGEEGTVVIRKDQRGWSSKTDKSGATDPKTWTGTKIGEELGKGTNGNTLWMVYIQDGVVIDINGGINNYASDSMKAVNQNAAYKKATALNATTCGMVSNTGVPYGATTESTAKEVEEYLGIYEDLSIVVVDVTENVEVDADTITLTLADKTTLDLTVDGDPVVGEWKALETAKDYPQAVIAVYDENGNVVQAYIYEIEKAAEKPDPVYPTYAKNYVTFYTRGSGNEILVSAQAATDKLDIQKLVIAAIQDEYGADAEIEFTATNKVKVTTGKVTLPEFTIYTGMAARVEVVKKAGDKPVLIGTFGTSDGYSLADILKATGVKLDEGQYLVIEYKQATDNKTATLTTDTLDVDPAILVKGSSTVTISYTDTNAVTPSTTGITVVGEGAKVALTAAQLAALGADANIVVGEGGTVTLGDKNAEITDLSKISFDGGTVSIPGKLTLGESKDVEITDGTLEVKEVAAGKGKITVKAGATLEADKIDAGANIAAEPVTEATAATYGSTIDVQTATAGAINEAVKASKGEAAGSVYLRGIVGAVVLADDTYNDVFGDTGTTNKDWYFFAWTCTADQVGKRAVVTVAKEDDGTKPIYTNNISEVNAKNWVHWANVNLSSDNKMVANNRYVVTVKVGGTTVATASFTYSETT